MESVDCGIDQASNKLSFDRSASELEKCKKADFHFDIRPAEDKPGFSVAVLEISLNGTVLRRFTSKPFPTGQLKEKSRDLNKMNFIVKLGNPNGLQLSEYF